MAPVARAECLYGFAQRGLKVGRDFFAFRSDDQVRRVYDWLARHLAA